MTTEECVGSLLLNLSSNFFIFFCTKHLNMFKKNILDVFIEMEDCESPFKNSQKFVGFFSFSDV